MLLNWLSSGMMSGVSTAVLRRRCLFQNAVTWLVSPLASSSSFSRFSISSVNLTSYISRMISICVNLYLAVCHLLCFPIAESSYGFPSQLAPLSLSVVVAEPRGCECVHHSTVEAVSSVRTKMHRSCSNITKNYDQGTLPEGSVQKARLHSCSARYAAVPIALRSWQF